MDFDTAYCDKCGKEVDVIRASGKRKLGFHFVATLTEEYSRVQCEGSLGEPTPLPAGDVDALAFTVPPEDSKRSYVTPLTTGPQRAWAAGATPDAVFGGRMRESADAESVPCDDQWSIEEFCESTRRLAARAIESAIAADDESRARLVDESTSTSECRRMPMRNCPASYGAPCGIRPCARFESDDETPWLESGSLEAISERRSMRVNNFVLSSDSIIQVNGVDISEGVAGVRMSFDSMAAAFENIREALDRLNTNNWGGSESQDR